MADRPEEPENLARDLLRTAGGHIDTEEEPPVEDAPDSLENATAYTVVIRSVPFNVVIKDVEIDKTPTYIVREDFLQFLSEENTVSVRSELLNRFQPRQLSVTNLEEREELEDKFESEVFEILDQLDLDLSPSRSKRVAVSLVLEMIDLGRLEIPLRDPQIEEVCINSSHEPVWLYHKEHGWVRTNIRFKSEKEIENLADKIAANFGKEITTAHPVLDDARLITGDRAAATLSPISTSGNTITIRKFRREPWTIIDFISDDIHTLNLELASLLWLAIQYETNILVAGGTASGKTSLLNSLLMFIPPEQRTISIEDVREIRLHENAHWVPLAARESYGAEAENISVLDLMLLALRMRPDRIVLGEVRSTEEAQTLFEAAETGHSIYSTLHANDINGIFRRLLNPPIDIPKSMMASVHLALVQYRQRRKGFRRTLQAAEIVDLSGRENVELDTNLLYQWQSNTDTWDHVRESKRLFSHIKFFSGMDDEEIQRDLEEKQRILKYMLKNNIRDIESVSKTIHTYYNNLPKLRDYIDKGKILE